MCAIHSAKAAWAVAKEVDVAAKVQIVVIMAIKSRGEMGIVSIGVVEVLGPTESTRTGGIGGSNDAGSGSVAVGTMDAEMWGFLIGATGGGWSSARSLSRRGGASAQIATFPL